MPSAPRRPAALAGRVFRGGDAVHHGLLTADDLRSRAWTRVRHDVYADAALPRDHELACHAALARLPAGAAVAGRLAAFLHGVEHAAGYDDEVHVITAPAVRVGAQRGLRVHHLTLRPDEVTGRWPLMTSAARTAWDLAAWLDPIDAVPIVDTLLNRGRATPAELARHLERQTGRRGWRRAQRVHDLADPRAQSPAESRLRVRLVLAGLPRPVAQCPVRVSSSLVLHPDLGWPNWRVAVEYDGQWHADAGQLHRDRRRLNRLVAAGWAVLHVTGRRMHTDFAGIVGEVRTTLAERGWRPARTRSSIR